MIAAAERGPKMRRRVRVPQQSLAVVALVLLLSAGASVLPAQERPAGPGSPQRVEGAVTRPEKIAGAVPVYTEEARKARVMGVVIVEAIIDEQGSVTDARVLKGLPMGLSEAARAAIQTWKFKPATLDGRPVKVYYTLTVNFQVESPLRFGPQLREFLKQNPDFAKPLLEHRYQDAAELLDHWAAEGPADPEIHLARCYLFLAQGRLDDAFQEALGYRGTEPYEILQIVAYTAWDRATYDRTFDDERRAKVIDLGLQAEALAMAARSDTLETIVLKGLLLQLKAGLTTDPAERQSATDEAKELMDQAKELRAKAQAAGLSSEALSPVLGGALPGGVVGGKEK